MKLCLNVAVNVKFSGQENCEGNRLKGDKPIDKQQKNYKSTAFFNDVSIDQLCYTFSSRVHLFVKTVIDASFEHFVF